MKIKLKDIKRDPIEQTESFKMIEQTVNIKAYNRVISFIDKSAELNFNKRMEYVLNTMYGYDRFCFEKKKILLEEYDIEWQSPTELNPQIDFDNLELIKEEEQDDNY